MDMGKIKRRIGESIRKDLTLYPSLFSCCIMKRLYVKECYEYFIRRGYQKSIVLLGRNLGYKIGEKIEIAMGKKIRPKIILRTTLLKVIEKKWIDLRDSDLIKTSPDCRTKLGLWCVLYLIFKRRISNKDYITMLEWL